MDCLLPLNKSTILRYLGYRKKQELPAELDAIIDKMIVKIQKIAKPRYHYQVFNLKVDEKSNKVDVLGTKLILTGKKIVKHLRYAKKVALLVATLGIEVERKIRHYDISDATKALIADAVCTDYIEKICDLAEVDLKKALGNSWYLNRRFSPGYGDLPLSVQPNLLETMQSFRKLGVHLNDNFLMIPMKSVTAIIGLFDQKDLAKPRWQKSECEICQMGKQCSFRV
jgi:hypothetical protein